MSKLNIKLSKRKIESTIILLFCILVAVSVISFLLFIYNPDQNAIRALASVCMDVMCIVIVLIFILSITYESHRFDRTTKLFLGLLIATLWALFTDFVNWALDGSLEFGSVSNVFTMLSLCMGPVLASIYVFYLTSYIDDMYDIKALYLGAKICAVCNLAAFILTTTLGITQKAFEYNDGHYETGALYDLLTVIPVLSLVYMTVFAIIHIKTIGIHDTLAIVGYIVLMIVGAFVEASYSIGTTYVGLTIADIFIFVMLQNRYINEARKNIEKWRKKSQIDEMTGFYNRYAYEDAVATLGKETISENFVYVSIDVNGLKVVNDSLGHAAGDELIVGACNCMKQCLGPYGKLYRTGGDEFAAILYVDDRPIRDIMKELEAESSKWHGKLNRMLAFSYGYVTKKEAGDMPIHEIAVLADKRMYEGKTRYYRKKGIDRRGQRDAHVSLCEMYTKILKVNLTDDSYQIVNMNVSEMNKEKGFDDSFSAWLKKFAAQGQVHPDDVSEFLAKTDRTYMSEYFMRSRAALRVFYRRKYGEKYCNTMLEIIHANDYSDDMQNLFLYVKNIESNSEG